MTKPLHIHHHPGTPPAVTVDSLVEWLKEYQLRTFARSEESAPESTKSRLQGRDEAICAFGAALGAEIEPADIP